MSTFETSLAYRRRVTREVRVGGVGVGGSNPIRVQSMLTSNTWDVDKVLPEMEGLVRAGCEIVRLTVPTRRDVEALPEIRRRMAAAGLTVPLVADIHFNPKLALACVPHVEKVRINPGNYVDDKRFAQRAYTDEEYTAELMRVEEEVVPLIRALREHGRALRIGVNHGSLSDRVLNRYGDTPEGMVECAMEYLRICARHGYHEIIVSMKSSNPLVVIQAYRLLALAMEQEEMDYPLHLGVTEAGDGADGRLKSAIGIGALLCDGLGDTVRVSLTEPSINEIPAARELVAAVDALQQGPQRPEQVFRTPIDFARRPTRRVRLGLPGGDGADVGGDVRVAFLAVRDPSLPFTFSTAPEDAELFDALLDPPAPFGVPNGHGGGVARLVRPENADLSAAPLVIQVDDTHADALCLERLLSEGRAAPQGGLLLYHGAHPLQGVRRLVQRMDLRGLDWPVGAIVPAPQPGDPLGIPLGVAAQLGSLAADGLLDALVCPTNDPAALVTESCKTLLQAARLRTYRTEYISCPSCGRTLFDLQETTEAIKARTRHLKGVKIGIMGCIVNGPGEMADADFGYVGGAPGKISLYRGQTCVQRGIPAGQAVDKLIDLIKAEGLWVEG